MKSPLSTLGSRNTNNLKTNKMTTFTNLYEEIREAEAQAVRDEISAIRLNQDHSSAILENTPKVAEIASEYLPEDYEPVPQEVQEAFNKRMDELEHQNYLDMRYTYYAEDTVFLHKSKRTFSTNSPLNPKDAYSVKNEMGLTWKQMDWVFNKNND